MIAETQFALCLEGVSQKFRTRSGQIEVLTSIDLQIQSGELIAIVGKSGCGKSTLLLAAGAMRKPTLGKVMINGQSVFEMKSSEKARFRSKNIGYLFQTLELIPYLTCVENVQIVSGASQSKAKEMLAEFGLADRFDHKPEAMSQGERQRTALVRALVHSPVLLIADEPTGNLDEENSMIVFETLRNFADRGGTVLLATHDSVGKGFADSVFKINNGELEKLN